MVDNEVRINFNDKGQLVISEVDFHPHTPQEHDRVDAFMKAGPAVVFKAERGPHGAWKGVFTLFVPKDADAASAGADERPKRAKAPKAPKVPKE